MDPPANLRAAEKREMWVPQRQAWSVQLRTVVSCDGEIYPQINQTAGKKTKNVALFGTNRTP